jgi:osmotically-inducible protein OsmY
MFRALFRLVLVLIILVGVGGFFLGWWGSNAQRDPAVGTSGSPGVERARDVGAQVGEGAARAANQAKDAVGEGTLTAKIKSKMALDDTVKAAAIDVDTNGSVVTLTGRVGNDAERQRALQLARETDGVTSVVDRLTLAAR